MLMDAPHTLLYLVGGAFLLGWFVGKVGAYFGARFQAKKRDPRDNRIRSLEAEHRVARSDADKTQGGLEERGKELAEAMREIEKRDSAIDQQLEVIAQLRANLKESVMKTRELRVDLSDRAAENVKSEVKLREVETELSVVKASGELIATGLLDYSGKSNVNDEDEDEDDHKALKAAT